MNELLVVAICPLKQMEPQTWSASISGATTELHTHIYIKTKSSLPTLRYRCKTYTSCDLTCVWAMQDSALASDPADTTVLIIHQEYHPPSPPPLHHHHLNLPSLVKDADSTEQTEGGTGKTEERERGREGGREGRKC